MKNLVIAKAERTPLIDFNVDKGTLKIIGWSLPENALGFYAPLMEALSEFMAHSSKKKIDVSVELEYYNTSSSKCLLDMFRKVGEMKKRQWDVTVTWLYYDDDEDMLSGGMDFQSLVDYEFNIKKTQKKAL